MQKSTIDPKIDHRPVRAKGWFLTYPRCTLSLEDAKDLLESKSLSSPVKAYVIAREYHEDGTPHLHVFIKYSFRVQWSSSLWDLGSYHGNYQVAKSWKCVERYVKKKGDYITFGMDSNSTFIRKGLTGKELLMMDPVKALDDDVIKPLQFESLVKNQNLYRLLCLEPYNHMTVRGLWIHGKPGCGKSYYAREYLQTKYGTYFIKAQNKWFDGYKGEHGILLEDLDSFGACLGHHLKIWLDSYPCNGEVKGSTVPLCHREFVITSNCLPEELWTGTVANETMAEAVRRRCSFIRFTGFKEFLIE